MYVDSENDLAAIADVLVSHANTERRSRPANSAQSSEFRGNMEPVIEQAGKAVASDVLKEAAEELTGRSKRKWAVVV